MLYRILRPIIHILFKVLYRPKILGLENIPESGAYVLAGNHTNNLDCIMLIASNKRTIHFLAKDELVNGFFGFFFKNMGIIPVNRRIHDKDALINAKKVLADGKVIGIFPEGTFNRSNDTILPFKIGAVKMAHDEKVPIIPFTIKGKYKLFRKGITLEFYDKINVESDNLDSENKKFMNIIKCELERS